jgi:serine/threonine protein kinase
MARDKLRIDVMVSSTTMDLGEHRRSLDQVITSLRMVPRMMDNDVATGQDGLTYSLALVNEAEIYILLLGFRYGHVPDDRSRNPDKLSMTHLEYRRAKERAAQGDQCVFAFLLHDDLKPEIVRPELTAFRKEVMGDQVVFFKGIEDLKLRVMQTLSIAKCVERLKVPGGSESDFKPHVGEVLDRRYTLERKLGQGGNGEVWKARERLPDGSLMDVALKLLKPEISEDPRRVERFKKEIAVARRLRHPNIILTSTYGEVGSQFFAVMDFVEGPTLRDFITGRHFSDSDTFRYLGQIAEALNAAHQQGVVHRDVKPENILVRDDKLYLGDFGLAVSPGEDKSLTATGELVGTKKYMAPEQWDNQPTTPQTDIYALGIIAYEMLTGEFPYDTASHARLMQQHMNDPLPGHPNLPDEIIAILRRATAKIPTARQHTALAFIADLCHWKYDPENIDTRISKYLDTLRIRLKGDVYEKLFVDMEGDIRAVIQQVTRETTSEDAYHDPLLDDEFGDLLDEFMVDLDADHHQPQAPQTTHVTHIADQLVDSDRVVLVGEPGSGKSFTLRRLMMHCIREYQTLQRVPVFIPLNAFKGETTFADYIKAQMGAGLAQYFEQLRDNKRLVLICDALNEMPRNAPESENIPEDLRGRDLVAEVRDELAKAPHFVVSCRVRDYKNDLDSLKLEYLKVRDLDLPAIREFVRRYKLLLKYDDDELWRRMGGSDDLFTFWQQVREKDEADRFWDEQARIPSYTSVSADQAWRQMWQGAKLIPLSRNPYLARVICGLHGRDQMPNNRAALYEAFVADLYERERKHATQRGQSFPERETLETFLTDLANQMQAGQTTVLKVPGITESDLLQAGLDATILTQDGDDLRFAHQLLQEYFAARTLLEKMMADADPVPVLGETWWNVSVWRETANMLIDFSKEPLRVMRWIAPASLPLVEEIASTHDIPVTELGTDFLLKIAEQQKDAENPIGRAAAYRVLGHPAINADDRPGVGLRADGLPDIDWVTIRAGEFTYQNDKMILDYDFQISRYPLTYAQFQAFIDDSEGFCDPRWWEGLSIPDGHNDAPGEQAFKYWNHPRERVSWYDAIALCRWLSWRLGGGYELDKIDEWAVRLPTEFEWERAARGIDGRHYPYEGEFDPAKGNTIKTNIGQTSAVGIFPNGASPEGVLDMSGNVWDWCLTDNSNPHERAADEDIRSDTRRVVRGGSWSSNLVSLARAAYRVSHDPSFRGNFDGFRLVRAPSQSLVTGGGQA